MMRMHYIALILVVLAGGSTCDVKLVGNGYENFNIFVKDSVKEDPGLIDRIEEVFTNVSALMFKATKNRAYIRNITIVLPKKWKLTASDPQPQSVSPFGEHIRVDSKNRARGDAPYTRGHLECGKPGWFMHLTPDFLNTRGDTVYGPHANKIVHEWGHLRWGLFDEYASIQHPETNRPNRKIQFYNENGKWRPVTCSIEITGGAYRNNCDVSKPCNLNSIKVPSQCAFCPDKQQTATTSFMSSQWIQSMEGFCDEDNNATDPSMRHNSKAPNAQNFYCNGRSAWEVMRNHEDFRDGNNPAASPLTNTAPTFQVVQQREKVRVFVYDVSGSMAGTKIMQQKQASYVVIDNVIETGSWLGLVQFSSGARTLAQLTEVKNKAVRSQLKAHVPTTANGSTFIDKGLTEALKVIESSPFPTEGSEIILLSDGESEPYLDIIHTLQKEEVTVHTISITQNADAGMAKLAADTGGKSYTFLETESVSFVDVLSQAITDGSPEDETIEKIFGYTFAVRASAPISHQFSIDSGVGNSTTITLIRTGPSAHVTLNITGPDGRVYTNTSTSDIMALQLDDNAPVGKYEFNISTTSTSDITVEVTITSRPVSDEAEVIRVISVFSNSTLDFNSGEELRLYASVEKAGSPILNATVTSTLAGDRSFTTIELVMNDNGLGADLVANDGVYSVYILKSYFVGDSRYNIKVVVSGDDGAYTYTSDTTGADGAASLPEALEEVDYIPVQVGEFQRQSIPGEITVTNYKTGDVTPPARITDFRVESITRNNGTDDQTITYTFVWTAVGDDMDVGNASNYDMRMDADDRRVRNFFDSSPNVPVNLSQPKPSGETERYSVTFSTSDCNGTCFLAVRATDDSGLKGDISNLANVDINFSYEPVEEFPDEDVDDVDDADVTDSTVRTKTTSIPESIVDTKSDERRGLSDEVILGLAGGAVFCVVIVVVGVSLILLKCRKARKDKRRHVEGEEHGSVAAFNMPRPQFSENPMYIH